MIRSLGAALLVALTALGGQNAMAQAVPKSAEQVKLTFAPLVKAVSPAVVNIYARRRVQQQQSPNTSFNDAFLRRFFGEDFLRSLPQERVQNSLGSGVIVREKGLVVTNNHVVKGMNEIRIVLADRREFDGELLLSDERSDLAVLRIVGEAQKFPYLEMGDADAAEVGDLAVAIGNPFGLNQTVTFGIISATARTTRTPINQSGFFIQTDAAINPGNSGGALVDLGGGLVGINTAIYSRNGASVGIGFAIPSNLVALVIQAALNDDTLHRPWIGAGYTPLTLLEAEAMGLRSNHGAVVTFVTPDSPAAVAGLAVGDAVLTVNGMAIDHPSGLTYRMLLLGLEGEVTLGIARGDERLDLAVAPVEAPETVPRDSIQLPGRTPFTGATLLNLSPLVAQEIGYTQEPVGVIVAAVLENSFAATAGLERGDVIAILNGTAITDTTQLAEIVDRGASEWQIEILREGRTLRSTFSLRR
jgi:Do/DeqQ family serine protease